MNERGHYTQHDDNAVPIHVAAEQRKGHAVHGKFPNAKTGEGNGGIHKILLRV